jgi:hypothetical protein
MRLARPRPLRRQAERARPRRSDVRSRARAQAAGDRRDRGPGRGRGSRDRGVVGLGRPGPAPFLPSQAVPPAPPETPEPRATHNGAADHRAALRRLLTAVASAHPSTAAPRASAGGARPRVRIAPPALGLERGPGVEDSSPGTQPARAWPQRPGQRIQSGECEVIHTRGGRTNAPPPSASSFGSGQNRPRTPGTTANPPPGRTPAARAPRRPPGRPTPGGCARRYR